MLEKLWKFHTWGQRSVDLGLQQCDSILKNEQLMKTLRAASFDAVLFDPMIMCSDLVADVLGLPSIISLRFSPGGILERHCGHAPAPPSFVPPAGLSYSDQMTFVERLISTVVHVFLSVTIELFWRLKLDVYYSEVKGQPDPWFFSDSPRNKWFAKHFIFYNILLELTISEAVSCQSRKSKLNVWNFGEDWHLVHQVFLGHGVASSDFSKLQICGRSSLQTSQSAARGTSSTSCCSDDWVEGKSNTNTDVETMMPHLPGLGGVHADFRRCRRGRGLLWVPGGQPNDGAGWCNRHRLGPNPTEGETRSTWMTWKGRKRKKSARTSLLLLLQIQIKKHAFLFCVQVIWRYKGERPTKVSANTRISGWIPQNDLLGAHTHSNTHTGVNPSKKKTHKYTHNKSKGYTNKNRENTIVNRNTILSQQWQ